MGDLFDGDKFAEGDEIPFVLIGEFGYQFGRYSCIAPPPAPSGCSKGGIRHALQVLGRYVFRAEEWRVAPYLDGGINTSLGGDSPSIGPSFRGGFDIVMSEQLSLFVEFRINVTFGDEAIDGLGTKTPFDAPSALPALGLRFNVSRNGLLFLSTASSDSESVRTPQV